jgi:hypothetical protein
MKLCCDIAFIKQNFMQKKFELLLFSYLIIEGVSNWFEGCIGAVLESAGRIIHPKRATGPQLKENYTFRT